MTTRIKLRRDTAANWTSNNPILAAGEPGLETDTGKTKYGDGATAWADLSYATGGITAREQIGYFTGVAPEIPATTYSQWFDTVVADPDGNAYYVGGQDDGPNWIRVVKVDTTGARVWEKEIDWADGYEGAAVSAVYNTATNRLFMVAELAKNVSAPEQEDCFAVIKLNPYTGAIVDQPTVVRDDITSDGSNYGWMSPTDIILTADGDPVVSGSKGGNAVLFPVTTATGSTVDALFVDAEQFANRYPLSYNDWYITGTNITSPLSIVGVNSYDNRPATAQAGTGTGATFTISSDGAGGYVIDTISNGGSGYRVGNKILILGSNLGGVDSTNDLTITVDTVLNSVITGASGNATSTGTATYTVVSGTNIASGSNATFNAHWRMRGSEVYFPDYPEKFGVWTSQSGSGFAVGDTLTLPAASYGGSTTGTITVLEVNSGAITNWAFTGTYNTSTIKLVTSDSFNFGTTGSWTVQNFESEAFVWTPDWCVNFGSSDNDRANAMARDSQGNIYVAVETYDNSRDNLRGSLVKISSTGTLVWSKNFDPVEWDNDNEGYTGVVVDSNDDIIVVEDELITKVDSDGNVLWQKWIMGGIPYPFDMWNACVDIDSEDNIYLAAEYDYPDTTESDNFLIIKFDTDGNVLWQREAGTGAEENSNWTNGFQIISVQGDRFYIAGSAYNGDEDTAIGISLPTDGSGARNEYFGRYLYRETEWDISTSTSTVDVMEIGFQNAEVVAVTTNTFTVTAITDNVVETIAVRTGNVDGRISNLYSVGFEDGSVQRTAYTGGLSQAGHSPRIYNTNDYTLNLGDAGKMIRWYAQGWGNSVDIYVPNHDDVPFDIGTQIHFIKDDGIDAFMFWNGFQGDDNDITILPANPAEGMEGSAFNSGEGWSVHHIEQFNNGSDSAALVTLTKIDTNRWLLSCSSPNHVMDWSW